MHQIIIFKHHSYETYQENLLNSDESLTVYK